MWWNDRCFTRSVRDDLLVGLDCVWEIDRTHSYSQMQDAVTTKSYNVYQPWKIPKFTWTNVIKFDCFFGIFLTLLFARIHFCHFWPMDSCFRLRQCAITICGTFWVLGIWKQMRNRNQFYYLRSLESDCVWYKRVVSAYCGQTIILTPIV